MTAGIVAVIINPVNGKAASPRDHHVIPEILEGIKVMANTNTSASVALVHNVPGIRTSLPHPAPRLVSSMKTGFYRSASMSSKACSSNFTVQAPAGFGVSASQGRTSNHDLVTAFAITNPIRDNRMTSAGVLFWNLMGELLYGESLKFLSNQIAPLESCGNARIVDFSHNAIQSCVVVSTVSQPNTGSSCAHFTKFAA